MATIGGYPVRKLLRNSCLSALAAATCGLSHKQLKKRPGKIKTIFAYSLAAGGTGLLLGVSYGWYRKDPNIYFRGLSGCVNLFLLSGCYMGVREAMVISDGLQFEAGNKRVLFYQSSAASGAITGFLAGVFWLRNIIPIFGNSVAFCTVAATGQFLVDRYTIWKTSEAIRRHYPELQELQWQLLDEEEKNRIRKREQGLLKWIWDLLHERPYAGKLALKIEALEEEFVLLSDEEKKLKEDLNILDDSIEDSNLTIADAR